MKAKSGPSAARDVAVILIAGLLLLVPAAASIDLFNPDEPREAEIAREMVVSHDRVVPLFNGCPFLEKPPLFYWAVGLASALPGLGREMAARLPSVLTGLGLLLVVYALGRELADRRTGRAAAFVLLTTFQFWWYAKRALLDMTLALFVGVVMLCVLLGQRRMGGEARPGWPGAHGGWLLLAGAAGVGAAMTKGLIGLVIPAVALVVFLAWTRTLRFLLDPRVLVAALLPLGALAVWVGALVMRPEGACFVREFLVENHVRRFLGGGRGGHAAPFWYYLETLLTDYQPWIAFLPAAMVPLWPGWRPRGMAGLHALAPGDTAASTSVRAQEKGTLSVDAQASRGTQGPPSHGADGPSEVPPSQDATRNGASRAAGLAFLWSWLVPPLLVLSLASTKRSLYLLPLAAPIALLIALWWRGPSRRRSAATRGETIGSWWLLAAGVLASVALPVAIAVLASGTQPRHAADVLEAIRREPSGIPAGIAALAAVYATALLARRRRQRAAAAALLLAWAFWFVAGTVVLPLAQSRLSARSVGEAIRAARERGASVAAYGLSEGSLGQFLFYSEGTLDWIGRRGRNPESPCTDCRRTETAEEYLAAPGPRACLLLEGDYGRLAAHLPTARILMRAKVGGASYVLLAKP